MSEEGDFDTLAHLLFLSIYKSRRAAKRAIREAGGHGSAKELDTLLASIRSHPRRAEIQAEAHAMGEAFARTEAVPIEAAGALRRGVDRDAEAPLWIFGEDALGVREFLVHDSTAASFVAEVLAPGEEDLAGMAECYPLTEGYTLARITWWGDRPPDHEVAALMREAAGQFRLFNARIDNDLENHR